MGRTSLGPKRAAERNRSPRRESAAISNGAEDSAEPEEAPLKRARGRTPTAAGDELGAADLAKRVADGLRRYRADRHLSLDELSARSGVSRAALSQIEGGRTNPTLAVLWKIAVGLDIQFHDLLGPSADEAVLTLRAGDAPPLRSADGRTESRLLSPGGASTDTEVYELRLVPKATLRSDPHARGTTETLVVLSGSLRLIVGAVEHDLSPGDSAFFRADVAHAYENRTSREVRCLDVIHYVRA